MKRSSHIIYAHMRKITASLQRATGAPGQGPHLAVIRTAGRVPNEGVMVEGIPGIGCFEVGLITTGQGEVACVSSFVPCIRTTRCAGAGVCACACACACACRWGGGEWGVVREREKGSGVAVRALQASVVFARRAGKSRALRRPGSRQGSLLTRPNQGQCKAGACCACLPVEAVAPCHRAACLHAVLQASLHLQVIETLLARKKWRWPCETRPSPGPQCGTNAGTQSRP